MVKVISFSDSLLVSTGYLHLELLTWSRFLPEQHICSLLMTVAFWAHLLRISSQVLCVFSSSSWSLIRAKKATAGLHPCTVDRRRLDRTGFLLLGIRFMNEALNPLVLHAFEQSPRMILCRKVDHGGSPSVQWGKRLLSAPCDIANLLHCNYGVMLVLHLWECRKG